MIEQSCVKFWTLIKWKYICWPIYEKCFQKKMLDIAKEELQHSYDYEVTFIERKKGTKWWLQMNYSIAWDFQEESDFWILRQWDQRDISVSFIRKKANLRMKYNLWFQRERADSKVFELIKEIRGCSLVSAFCRHISKHLCLFPRRWWLVYFVVNIPYGHERY